MPEQVGSDPRRPTTTARWQVLGAPRGMLFYQVKCVVEDPGWHGPTPEVGHRVFLGRAGTAQVRLNGRVSLTDATSMWLTRPGDEMATSHPHGDGDVYSCLELDPEVLAARPDTEQWLHRRGWWGSADERLDLDHRMLVAQCRRGIDQFEVSERLHRFLGRLLSRTPLGPGEPGAEIERAVGRRPATLAAHRRLADRAREVLAGSDFRLGLTEVAEQVGCSPHHLSRVFQRVTGQSLTAYRNRLRVRSVLTVLADGDGPPLGEVAAAHGFADQAHLTRVVREQVGHPPARLRRLFAARDGGAA
ncbi:helix-turn-helix transcriptional regulator [Micromonospora soli]|uniref:helix-turn-helix domain-containing protein n=1 Tax=Micromonospora sp. NBRC 110009 TaxID=3061627 RepID=UPI0026714DF7|nr:helix-turn-helix transcriptional regulator [Micromonospora sp. NBRC 110009]WKU00173.1 helix-turn-helix transcriptional regulator [Micromonospora sp. NBRC 110009]